MPMRDRIAGHGVFLVYPRRAFNHANIPKLQTPDGDGRLGLFEYIHPATVLHWNAAREGATPKAGGQPRGERPFERLDRVWPDASLRGIV